MTAHVAYDTYAQNNVTVESPTKLIEMMYQGILRFNFQAKKALEAGDTEKRTYWINRSCAIFTELMNILDLSQGEVAHYLNGLYSYQLQTLMEASLEKDPAKIDQVSNVVKGLLEAWKDETHVA